MNETTWQQWAITITTFLPIAGAIVVLLVPSSKDKMIRGLGVVTTALAFACSIAIAIGFDYSRSAELQFVKDVSWIPVIGARYHVGIDGISMPLFVLTYLLGLLCAIYTARYVPQPGRTKAFVALTLLLITGMAGTFISFDLILFFVFWELVLVPMYFLIGIWGSANRQYASIKFFLYTLFGSVFMLLGFLALYFTASDPVTAPAHVRPAGDHRLRCRRRVHAHVPARRVRGDRAGVRREGADVAVPHLVARRTHRGADDRLGPAGRDHAEDGHVRVHPDRAARRSRRAPSPTPRGSARSPRSRSSMRRSRVWPRRT